MRTLPLQHGGLRKFDTPIGHMDIGTDGKAVVTISMHMSWERMLLEADGRADDATSQRLILNGHPMFEAHGPRLRGPDAAGCQLLRRTTASPIDLCPAMC